MRRRVTHPVTHVTHPVAHVTHPVTHARARARTHARTRGPTRLPHDARSLCVRRRGERPGRRGLGAAAAAAAAAAHRAFTATPAAASRAAWVAILARMAAAAIGDASLATTDATAGTCRGGTDGNETQSHFPGNCDGRLHQNVGCDAFSMVGLSRHERSGDGA